MILKKFCFISLALVMIIGTLVIGSCGEPKETAQPTTTQPTTTQPTSTPTATATVGPVYGGKFVIVRNTGINEIGGPQELKGGYGGLTYPLWCPVTGTLCIVDAAHG